MIYVSICKIIDRNFNIFWLNYFVWNIFLISEEFEWSGKTQWFADSRKSSIYFQSVSSIFLFLKYLWKIENEWKEKEDDTTCSFLNFYSRLFFCTIFYLFLEKERYHGIKGDSFVRNERISCGKRCGKILSFIDIFLHPFIHLWKMF